MTKVIDLTKEAKEEKVLKPIELKSWLDAESREIQELGPCFVDAGWDEIRILCHNYRDSGLALMFASNNETQCLYLGKVNDGIV